MSSYVAQFCAGLVGIRHVRIVSVGDDVVQVTLAAPGSRSGLFGPTCATLTVFPENMRPEEAAVLVRGMADVVSALDVQRRAVA